MSSSKKAVKPPVPKSNPWGIDPAGAVSLAGRRTFRFNFWDLWIALVVEQKFNSDCDALRQELRRQRDSDRCGSTRKEQVLSHLGDLRRRLAANDLAPADLCIAAEAFVSAQEVKRAWKNVVEGKSRESDLSDAMKVLPKERFAQFAMRGYWPQFPVSPEEQAQRIRGRFKTNGYYSCDGSFGVAQKFDAEITAAEKLHQRGHTSEAAVRLRAILTVFLEVIELSDDSCGVIGDSFGMAFDQYVNLPLNEIGLDEPLFLADLLTFIVAEDYGFTHDHAEPFLARMTPSQREWSINHLRQLAAQLLEDDSDYLAKKAERLASELSSAAKKKPTQPRR